MATEKGLYDTINTSTTGTIPNKSHENLKLLNLRPALYTLMHKAVILNTYRIVRKFLAQQ